MNRINELASVTTGNAIIFTRMQIRDYLTVAPLDSVRSDYVVLHYRQRFN